MVNYKNFGKNLEHILQTLEISQVELARKSGLTPAAICQIIKGKRYPSLPSTCEILNVLNLTLEEVCGPLPDLRIVKMVRAMEEIISTNPNDVFTQVNWDAVEKRINDLKRKTKP